MLENEIFEKNNEKLTEFIDSDCYTFDIITLATNYFSEKDEILLKILKNIKVNGNKPTKLNIEKLVVKIRNDRFISNNQYQKYNNLQTVKQHYVKDSIQKKWDVSDCVLFKINGITIKNNKAFDENLENTLLIEYNDIREEDKKHFEPKSTYVKDFTFDVYGDDYFLYLEDGIVTILEKLFERTIENNIDLKFSELQDEKIKTVMNYFFTPYLDNRIKKYQEFSVNMYHNYKNMNVISTFIGKQENLYKLFIINKDIDIFNLTSDWIEYLYYTELYDECTANWTEAFIMPYSPKTALLFFDELSLNYFNRYPFDSQDFLLNTILSIVDKRMHTSDDVALIANEYYQANTLIRLANTMNKNYITTKFNNNKISKLLKKGNFKEISHIIVYYWRIKNKKNIDENIDTTDQILINQYKNVKKSFEANGFTAEDVIKKIYEEINNMKKNK